MRVSLSRALTRRLSLVAGVLALVAALWPAAPAPVRAGPPEAPVKTETTKVERGAQTARQRRIRARRARARRARARRARSYRRMVRRWHRRAPRSARRRWEESDDRPLVLRPVGQRDEYELVPAEDGRFDAEDLALAEQALAEDDGSSHAVHPRLLELVYRAVQHFEVPWVVVVSGYRPDRATSRHTQGRAIDMAMPGVSDRGLARYLTRQGFVGVGLYVGSGFVHLDVRESSYFWIDRSAPGQRGRRARIMRRAGMRADVEARRRGEEPVPDAHPGTPETEDPDADADVDADGENG